MKPEPVKYEGLAFSGIARPWIISPAMLGFGVQVSSPFRGSDHEYRVCRSLERAVGPSADWSVGSCSSSIWPTISSKISSIVTSPKAHHIHHHQRKMGFAGTEGIELFDQQGGFGHKLWRGGKAANIERFVAAIAGCQCAQQIFAQHANNIFLLARP